MRNAFFAAAWRHSQIPLFMGGFSLAISYGTRIGLALELPMWGVLVVGGLVPFALAVIALRRIGWI